MLIAVPQRDRWPRFAGQNSGYRFLACRSIFAVPAAKTPIPLPQHLLLTLASTLHPRSYSVTGLTFRPLLYARVSCDDLSGAGMRPVLVRGAGALEATLMHRPKRAVRLGQGRLAFGVRSKNLAFERGNWIIKLWYNDYVDIHQVFTSTKSRSGIPPIRRLYRQSDTRFVSFPFSPPRLTNFKAG